MFMIKFIIRIKSIIDSSNDNIFLIGNLLFVFSNPMNIKAIKNKSIGVKANPVNAPVIEKPNKTKLKIKIGFEVL